MNFHPYEGYIRVSVFQFLPHLIKQMGFSAKAVLAEVGLTPTFFDDGDQFLHIKEALELIEHCAHVTGQPHFPFMLAAKQDLMFLGDIGLLMQTAPMLGDALLEFPQYLHIHSEPISWVLEEKEDMVAMTVSVDAKGASITPLQRQMATELALAQAYNVIKTLTNNKIKLHGVTCYMPPPKDKNMFQQYFGARVDFNSEENALIMHAKYMKMPVSHSHPQLHELVRNKIRSTDHFQQFPTLANQVRNIIRGLLPKGNCSISAAAQIIGCDKRTLQNHLRNSGDTTYQALLDDVRFEQACLYLKDTNMPLTQLAYFLGFSDSSNMSRAFHAKSGMPPRTWRKENQSDSARSNRLALRSTVT